MKVFISVDMEGISGIVDTTETLSDHTEYQKSRLAMAADANAAIEGILDTGPSEIVVCDGHGKMINIPSDALHESAMLVRGTPKPLSQMAGIDAGFDAALFVGYHAMKGTRCGILSHTFSGKAIQYLKINGREAGETAMNAGIAGYFGVPLVFVSGDLAVAQEARALIPEIETVAVKEAISRVAAKCIHPQTARQMIRETVARALGKRTAIQPFAPDPPVTFEIRYSSEIMADAVALMPSAERIDGQTVRFVQDDYLKAFGAFRASVSIALSVDR